MRRSALIKALLSAVLLLALLLPGAAQKKLAVESALVDAVADFNAGRYADARARLKVLAAADPSIDAVWYYYGLTEACLGNKILGREYLRKAVELDPSNYWYKQRLAILYESLGMDSEVMALYEDILKTHPDKVEIVYSLLSLYLKKGEYDKALGALNDLEALQGPSERIATTRHDILRSQGKLTEAAQALKDFNEKFSSPEVLTALGDYYLSEYDDSLALASFDEALSLESTYIPAILGKAEVYRMTKNTALYFPYLNGFISDQTYTAYPKGMYLTNVLRTSDPQYIRAREAQFDSVFDTLVITHPSDSLALSTAGTYFYTTGRSDKALSLLKKNADLYPESSTQTSRYLTTLVYDKKWEEARDRAAAAWERFPDELIYPEIENIADFSLEDYGSVVTTCKKVISMHPKDTSVTIPFLSSMGDALYQGGNKKEAFKTYKKVLKIRPDYNPVLNNYAYFLSLDGKKLAKAEKMSRETVITDPDNATYLDTYGWILHLQGKDAEAKKFFKRAMLYGGKENPTVMEHYAEVLEALGEDALARVYRSNSQQ